jgi:transglutaminase-like putative cysteine protease
MSTGAMPSLRAMFLVLAAFAVSVLLHVDRVPAWCVVAAGIALAWHCLFLLGRLRLPGTALRLLIAATLFAATLASFRTLQGLGAGSALLLVMGAAKLLEIRRRRDAMVMAFVSLVLLLAACLDRQSLVRMPLYLAAGWSACAAIAALGATPASQSVRRAFRTAGIALLLGLPFAGACFLLVPRLPGPLWSWPSGDQARTGLDDQMSPGSISELSASDESAFRVRFEGPPPPASARYWRGPVLHDFDGYTWRRARGQIAPTPVSEARGTEVRYHVLLEPHGRNWLYGLDTIRNISGQFAFLTFDGQAMSSRPVSSMRAYDGVSNLDVHSTGPLSTTGRRLDTQLPPGRNPRSASLALSMRAAAASDRDYTQRALELFRSGGFRYTLTPPRLGLDSVDDLLFNTRLGFCGHFASAYVTLMRAAGIPARVVTGYLGGEWNSLGGYFLIRQSDAHAWAEVWLDGDGWVRIDPTAVVAPERLQQGLMDLMPDRGPATSRLFRTHWIRSLAAVWDASGNWWEERVVRFNMASQMSLLQRLGLGNMDYRGMALLLLAAATAWGLLVALWTMRSAPVAGADALGATWQRYQALLRRRGMEIAPHEPPRAIARRAASRFPQVAAQVGEFTERYLALRYGAGPLSSMEEASQERASREQVSVLRDLLRRIARGTAAHRPARKAAAATG